MVSRGNVMPIRDSFCVLLTVASLLAPTDYLVGADSGSEFVRALLEGLRRHDVGRVTRLFKYPFRMMVDGLGLPVAVSSQIEMARLYDSVFNPAMRCAIEQSQLPTRENPRPTFQLAVVDGVVSLANSRLIAVRSDGVFKITRLSLLPGATSPRRRPQELTLSPKQAKTQASGRLSHDDVDTYLIHLLSRTALAVQIEGFPGSSLSLHIQETGNGAIKRGSATESARRWTGLIEKTGDYRIEVSRSTAYCDPELAYVLTVSVR